MCVPVCVCTEGVDVCTEGVCVCVCVCARSWVGGVANHVELCGTVLNGRWLWLWLWLCV